jgi:hypothetical protein
MNMAEIRSQTQQAAEQQPDSGCRQFGTGLQHKNAQREGKDQ